MSRKQKRSDGRNPFSVWHEPIESRSYRDRGRPTVLSCILKGEHSTRQIGERLHELPSAGRKRVTRLELPNAVARCFDRKLRYCRQHSSRKAWHKWMIRNHFQADIEGDVVPTPPIIVDLDCHRICAGHNHVREG